MKSPPELWTEIASDEGLGRWLGRRRPCDAAEAPGRLEWSRSDSAGVIELEASGWGTKVRAVAKAKGVPWERVARRTASSSARLEAAARPPRRQLAAARLIA